MTDQLRVLVNLFIKATDEQKQNIIGKLHAEGVDVSVLQWLAQMSSQKFRDAAFDETSLVA